MESTRTIQLKIVDPDFDLVETIKKYAQGMNYVSEIVFDNEKVIPARKLQPLVYNHLREELGLKSQVSCNIPRQVAGTYKTIVELAKQGLSYWQKIVYSPTSMILSYKRDYTITENSVSITTFSSGRKTYQLVNYPYAMQLFKSPWKFGASKVVKHDDGSYYFHLTVSQEIPDKRIEDASTFMGIDVGMNYLAVASTTDKKCKFFAGGEIKNQRNIYKNMRARLQSKGTSSAKSVMKQLAGKEKRLMKDVNHCISKAIVKFAAENNVSVIGFEDLTGIRTRTEHNISKKHRYHHSSWAFRQLQSFVAYKAKLAGIITEYVDPAFTSQTCFRCNHISRNNRHSLKFHCEICGYEVNADLNAANNLEHRTRDFRYTLESQGCQSITHTHEMI
ncbi:transposase, IS605 OrfB family, central region [Methanomethylovorans hollandica DSM 15978]|uniref:Transposase, IS605 OrfB family, central region n=1 Tax=Methanomethylovorans hollandica (strain DSM 15978 / NBRC 107637 / DMS1) TaxID=867904 RepID=L0KSH3_METHD|nr:RNA-guided endonuclease TnpB family protein [Methanomethylovorans hollandica]AGB48357.1 transposase, IS605 OrfB family, central region [Methanomethylovorans hollandica DSM 15978]